MGTGTAPVGWVLCVITAAGNGCASAAAARVTGRPEPGWADPKGLSVEVVGRWAGRR